MNLQLTNRLFIVCGATSGFGHATALHLLAEGAQIIAVARTLDGLEQLKSQHPDTEIVQGDITRSETILKLNNLLGNRKLDGILINAGGPPAKSFAETTLSDWDEAYKNLVRWKIELVQALMPRFTTQQYGRIVFVESASVKQPIPNLVLSTSLRLAVVGFVKTLALEVAQQGITLNVLAPGYHATPAMERLFAKKSELQNISIDDARDAFEKEIPQGQMGKPENFGALAAWLLSPVSAYLTGQTISVDGALIRSIFG